MKTQMTKNGVSTTRELGSEQFETYFSAMSCGTKIKRFQYDYRHTNGELFSCVKTSLEACRDARDLWLNEVSDGESNELDQQKEQLEKVYDELLINITHLKNAHYNEDAFGVSLYVKTGINLLNEAIGDLNKSSHQAAISDLNKSK
tara:strand:+ start:440 stop:877 length:438 start_codon:yes stop_codon:yes gene_type:complete